MAALRYPFLFLVLALALWIPAPLQADGGGGEARKTYIFRVDHRAKPSVFPTHAHWYASAAFASAAGAGPLEPLHVYDTVFHGFSASVPASRAEELRRHPAVLAAFEDRVRQLHTTRSPQFMGLRARLGLWSLADYGSDVIVGVLDTGVWPERRSLSDRNLAPVPARWRGGCDAGPGFPSSSCNKKLVGARFFSQGHDAHYGTTAVASNGSVEFLSPRDADGHGTHTTTTAAGSVAYEASMEGYALGVAKGVAPKARVAAYKVCWKGAGCMDSDILAGFDRAVADGVDVISVSIGGGNGVTSPFYLDPIAIGSYGAVSRGVFVATSAGNEGPTAMSVTNLAPWLATVGAGTIDRSFPAEIVLGDGRRLPGVSLYSGKPLANSSLPLYYPGRSGGLSASLCMENSIDPSLVKGKIVICDRGSSPRVAKGMVVKEAGGAAMILANGEANGEGLVGDAHVLPACSVGEKEGDALKAYAANASNPTATISFGGTVIGVKPAPVVASFSARGPNGLVPEILKPDFITPGVNILAAWTGATGPTGLEDDTRRTEFNILSGTSMACPHASGAAALLRSAHPWWSPAAIRSALMTTAIVVDNRGGPLEDEAEPGRAATPFDYGAGHITLGKALDPGLVYDAGEDDYVAFMCSIGYEANAIEVVTHKPVSCPATTSRNPSGSDLNYPSISVVLYGGNKSRTVIRTATNVGAEASATYKARVQMVSTSVSVAVKPEMLVFSPTAKKQSFKVTVTVPSAPPSSAPVYGYLVWSDGGGHDVRSPIVVTWLLPM
ncbi:subtilisin-like protease SBT1.6 [Phragmites australis]|uniref:subtilisin-like protease SBT1.6 n=1 Tax=Phragmites australis TaxID=29695 RepID=UPI002D79C80E|nr:subtilisin-like protease SBT1.6 [Phragmites australis]